LPEVQGEQGLATRRKMLPYGRQSIDEEDVQAVVDVLRSDWLTTGPAVERFERAVAGYVRTEHAVAVSSGTAALHAAIFALEIGPGDEVIVPAMTFAATANSVVYQGATPRFADVDPDTLLIDPASVESLLGEKTRAVTAVDFAGQPCDYPALRSITRPRRVPLVADASHALGAAQDGRPVGGLADLSTFSLHPVKPITTGEGGIITTDDARLADRMRRFRNHGLNNDHRQRSQAGSWVYEMTELGYNYRLTDFQSALGLAQIAKLDRWIDRRNEIADRYTAAFAPLAGIHPLAVRPGVRHGWHLYIVRLDRQQLGIDRAAAFDALRARGIGVGVHYIPVHLHPFYRDHFGTRPGLCPVAEAVYEEILSLPVFPAMTDEDVDDVILAIQEIASGQTIGNGRSIANGTSR
jgi:perosamine synthetase